MEEENSYWERQLCYQGAVAFTVVSDHMDEESRSLDTKSLEDLTQKTVVDHLSRLELD